MRRTVLLIFILLIASRLAFSEDETKIEYYPNGQIKSEVIYKDDILEGRAKWYYENGAIFKVADYKNGRTEGKFILYYDTGQIMEDKTVKYIGKVCQETITRYHKNGKLMLIIFRENGLPDGVVKEYYENGVLAKKTSYKKGLFDGAMREYDKQGNLISETIFKNDNFIEKKEF